MAARARSHRRLTGSSFIQVALARNGLSLDWPYIAKAATQRPRPKPSGSNGASGQVGLRSPGPLAGVQAEGRKAVRIDRWREVSPSTPTTKQHAMMQARQLALTQDLILSQADVPTVPDVTDSVGSTLAVPTWSSTN